MVSYENWRSISTCVLFNSNQCYWLLVITFLHLSTAGKSLKGSYPNVDNEQDRAYYAEHPKEALWWVKERRIRDFNKSINQSYISTLKLVGSANFKVLLNENCN